MALSKDHDWRSRDHRRTISTTADRGLLFMLMRFHYLLFPVLLCPLQEYHLTQGRHTRRLWLSLCAEGTLKPLASKQRREPMKGMRTE